MAKFLKHRSKKVGLPPGSYHTDGEPKTQKVEITLMDYGPHHMEFKTVGKVEETFPYRDKNSVSWINIYGLHNVEVLKTIDRHYGIHPLILEDIVHTDQRPKLEVFKDYIFIVLRMVWFDEKKLELSSEQLSFIVGHNFVICFQEWKGDVFHSIRERLKNPDSRLRNRGVDYLIYALLDVIVDNYFLVLEKVGDYIEMMEEEVLDNPDQTTLQRINQLKRDLIFLRKNVWPLREVVAGIERGEIGLFQESTFPFIRDLYDHVIRVIDTIESYRDLSTGLLDMYMTAISNRMNEVMKVLTIIATIFIPLTFIAGIYGMNFEYMPELHVRWAYPLVLVLMFALSLGMVWFFRKKRWL